MTKITRIWIDEDFGQKIKIEAAKNRMSIIKFSSILSKNQNPFNFPIPKAINRKRGRNDFIY